MFLIWERFDLPGAFLKYCSMPALALEKMRRSKNIFKFLKPLIKFYLRKRILQQREKKDNKNFLTIGSSS